MNLEYKEATELQTALFYALIPLQKNIHLLAAAYIPKTRPNEKSADSKRIRILYTNEFKS